MCLDEPPSLSSQTGFVTLSNVRRKEPLSCTYLKRRRPLRRAKRSWPMYEKLGAWRPMSDGAGR